MLTTALVLVVSASPAWLEVPARGSAPAARVRLTASGSRLTVELEGARGLDRAATGVHLWLADPVLVRRRMEDLEAAKLTLAEVQAALKDTQHQERECHDRLTSFAKRATAQLAVLRDEDPFSQVLLRFPEGAGDAGALDAVVLEPQSGGWTGVLDLSRTLRSAPASTSLGLNGGATVASLSVGVRFEPLASARPGPISGPLTATLTPPLELPVSAAVALHLLALGNAPFALRPTPQGSRPFLRGLVSELGCFGVEGQLAVPGEWSEVKPATLELPGGITLISSRNRLALGRGATRAAIELELGSSGDTELSLVDFREVKSGFVLVVTLSGASRPNGGMSMCGAGTETDAVWLSLSPSLTELKRQVVPIESCFTSASFEAADGGWDVSDFHSGKKTAVRYDRARPLEGFQTRSTPLAR